jgi:hypothetical protein
MPSLSKVPTPFTNQFAARRKAAARSHKKRDGPRLPELECGGCIARDEGLLHGGGIRRISGQHLNQPRFDFHETIRKTGPCIRYDCAVGDMLEFRSLDPDHAPPRSGEAGIDAEISLRCRHERETSWLRASPVRFMSTRRERDIRETRQADIFSRTESDISKFA